MTTDNAMPDRKRGRRAKYTEHEAAVVTLAFDTTLTYDQIGAEVGIPGWAARRLVERWKENARSPEKGNGLASSKEEVAEQSLPHAAGAQPDAEGGKA